MRKTDSNSEVFCTRGPIENDIMIMYRGSYRTFNQSVMKNVLDNIDKMILLRMSGQNE